MGLEQLREVSFPESIKINEPVYIDVRSPSEHQKASIPGSINIPLFDDEEREIVGLIYQENPQQARLKGLTYASSKLPQIVENIQEVSYKKTPVLYCWRGGMRSKSLCLLLQMMDITSYRLKGGYKAYRRFILQQLNSYEIRQKIYVLNGLTGVGKTKVLFKLSELGCPTIDLESIANHRGSLFGHLGIKNPQSQKNFDSILWEHLEQLKESNYLITEGEGRRIGSIFLPEFFFQAIKEGEHILLKAPIEYRVDNILKEYYPSTCEQIDEVESALWGLKKYLGNNNLQYLFSLLRDKQFYQLVRELCERYYDHLYKESREKENRYVLTVDATDPVEAAKTIKEFIEFKAQHHGSRYTKNHC